MTRTMKHWDAVFATAGFTGTVAFLNTLLGTAIGLLTVAVLFFRLRREWIHRNDKPKDE